MATDVNFELDELKAAKACFEELPGKFENFVLRYEWDKALACILESVAICHNVIGHVRPDKNQDELLGISTLALICEGLRIVCVLIEPVTPDLVEKLAGKLNLTPELRTWDSIRTFYPVAIQGNPIKK